MKIQKYIWLIIYLDIFVFDMVSLSEDVATKIFN